MNSTERQGMVALRIELATRVRACPGCAGRGRLPRSGRACPICRHAQQALAVTERLLLPTSETPIESTAA